MHGKWEYVRLCVSLSLRSSLKVAWPPNLSTESTCTSTQLVVEKAKVRNVLPMKLMPQTHRSREKNTTCTIVGCLIVVLLVFLVKLNIKCLGNEMVFRAINKIY